MSETISSANGRQYTVYSVTEVTALVNRQLDREPYNRVVIRGEISGWKLYASGHAYFSLKDEGALINGVMFADRLRDCKVRGELKDGVQVEMYGRLGIYGQRGSFQLVAISARLAGVGELMQRYLELKAKLEGEGLFDPARKRPLPSLPHRIGIVTSPTGAVIHDICTVLLRRFPNLEIRLFGAKVQGEGAAETVMEGLSYFNDRAPQDGFEADVLIVGRGGGSLEDLWCFNDEALVRAVAASRIPVISAVGHESDFTLCDFAADVRAGTPSIAAEISVPVKAELTARVEALSRRASQALRHRYETAAQRTDGAAVRLAAALRAAAADRVARLGNARGRLAPALRAAQMKAEVRTAQLAARLLPALRLRLAAAEARLGVQSEKLRLLDPLSALERGYSITTDAAGNVVKSAEQVRPGDLLRTRLAAGVVESRAE